MDRGSQGWAQQARSGPVGGLVWFGLARAGERDEERKRSAEWCGVALMAWQLPAGFAMRLQHEKTTHAVRIVALDFLSLTP